MSSIGFTVFGLLGGLSVFIFGMNMMSEGLQKAAGDKMKKIIGILTQNPVMGVLAGLLTTAVLQSSSATTVMVIGFVSAGLLSLPQAISVILGANIGTTITAQLLAFSIRDYISVILFTGFALQFIARNERLKNVGRTLFAFGLLFTGIETMGSVMKPLAASPLFLRMIQKVREMPVLGVAVGTFMTLLIQSSSATIAVLQNFASQPAADGVSSILGLTGAIPILLGDNVGTTITAFLACIGQSKDAKRTAAAHCIFNISGCIVFIGFIKPFAEVVRWISPKGDEVMVISRQIANAHTVFNVVMTVLWLPMIWLMVKLVMGIIPDRRGSKESSAGPQYLDEKLILQPVAALEMAAREALYCGELVKRMLPKIITAFHDKNMASVKEIAGESALVQQRSDDITKYLSNLFSAGVLTEEQSNHTAGLMYVLNDIERIGTLCGQMGDLAEERIVNHYKYSQEALEDIAQGVKGVNDVFKKSLDMLMVYNEDRIPKLLRRKERIMDLDLDLRKRHMKRVSKGKCSSKLTGPYSRILNTISRMGHSCITLADAVLVDVSFAYFIHEENG